MVSAILLSNEEKHTSTSTFETAYVSPKNEWQEDSNLVQEQGSPLQGVNFNKHSALAGTFIDKEEADLDDGQQEEIPIAVVSRMPPRLFTDEYLTILRKGLIQNILTTFEFMLNSFNDDVSFKMAKALFKNEINGYYRNFISGAQDRYFLSIISIYEDLLLKDTIEKKAIKESCSQLRSLIEKIEITTSDYKNISKRFFELGINIIGVKEEPIKN